MDNFDIKNHIIDCTISLLNEGYEMDELTVRSIASKANIATGLINYHFGSKDNLLLQSVEKIIDTVSAQQGRILTDKSISPRDRLLMFLSHISKMVIEYREYSLVLLKHELFSDSFETPKHILEILREMEPEASDIQQKWLSIQVVAPLQYIFLKEEGFYKYMDMKLTDIDTLIECHLKRLGI